MCAADEERRASGQGASPSRAEERPPQALVDSDGAEARSPSIEPKLYRQMLSSVPQARLPPNPLVMTNFQT